MAENNKSMKMKSATSTSRKIIVKILVIAGLIILVGSMAAWWQLVRNKPENIFDAMLNNNLRTSSVTRTVKQDNGYQKLEQIMRTQNRTEHVTNGVTKLTQGVGGSTVIVTESIGLPDVEYIKYNSIETTQKGSKGQELNFDDLLGVWSKNEPASEDDLSSLYQDVTLGNLFVFADFDQADRNAMLQLINDNKVYTVDYSQVEKKFVSGRQKYTYKVKISPVGYISMLKQYGSMVGLTQLENINPESYKEAAPIEFDAVIDVLSARLDEVVSGNGTSNQTFNGYGIIENIEIPKDAIPSEELQQRLTQSAGV